MTPADDRAPTPAEFKEEHAELIALLGKFRDACGGAQPDPDAVRDLAQELARELAEHFRMEESGGYFADAVRRAPQLKTTAEQLVAQHEPLLEAAEGLSALAKSGVESDGWWERIGTDFAKFEADLLDHEAGERSLLQRAYTEDIGTKD